LIISFLSHFLVLRYYPDNQVEYIIGFDMLELGMPYRIHWSSEMIDCARAAIGFQELDDRQVMNNLLLRSDFTNDPSGPFGSIKLFNSLYGTFTICGPAV